MVSVNEKNEACSARNADRLMTAEVNRWQQANVSRVRRTLFFPILSRNLIFPNLFLFFYMKLKIKAVIFCFWGQ